MRQAAERLSRSAAGLERMKQDFKKQLRDLKDENDALGQVRICLSRAAFSCVLDVGAVEVLVCMFTPFLVVPL